MIHSISFSKYFVVEAEGFARGLWMLWNEEKISMNILECSHYKIKAYVEYQRKGWLFTLVYASPHFQARQALWHYLDCVPRLSSLPWIIIGNFNEVLYNTERQGSLATIHSSGMLHWIHCNALINLEYIGAAYTWF